MHKSVTPIEYASLIGRTPDMVRNANKRRETPFEDEGYGSGAHRRLNGFHIVAATIFEFLTAQGLNAAQASEVVRDGDGIINSFLTEISGGLEPVKRFIVSERRAVFDEFRELFRWEAVVSGGSGTEAEVTAMVVAGLAAVGSSHTRSAPKDTTLQVRNIGGPHFAIASVNEAYRLATQRAMQLGYRLDGYNIGKNTEKTESNEA